MINCAALIWQFLSSHWCCTTYTSFLLFFFGGLVLLLLFFMLSRLLSSKKSFWWHNVSILHIKIVSWYVVTHSIKFVHLFVSAQLISPSDGDTQWQPAARPKNRIATFGLGWRINLAFCFYILHGVESRWLFAIVMLWWTNWVRCREFFMSFFAFASWFVLVYIRTLNLH